MFLVWLYPGGRSCPQHQAPVPSGRAGQALAGTVPGLSLSPGRAAGAHISATPLWLSLGLASCALTSLLNGLCFINCSQLPLLGHQGQGSARGAGNAALPLVPSLTPWARGTWGHPSYGASSWQCCEWFSSPWQDAGQQGKGLLKMLELSESKSAGGKLFSVPVWSGLPFPSSPLSVPA